jgi:hypothetical protein
MARIIVSVFTRGRRQRDRCATFRRGHQVIVFTRRLSQLPYSAGGESKRESHLAATA